MLSLYVHIPFCKEICSYCDFCKVYYQKEWADDYLSQLKKEIEFKKVPTALDTIYIGGGTPTSLNTQQIQRLMELLKPYRLEVKEYSIEVNPETMTYQKLQILYDGGVTRLSIGVQTFQEHLLTHLHRQHCNQDVFQVIQWAKEIGFTNISIDLMYGIPYQTKEDIIQDIEMAISLDIQHISYYSLILEEHTILSYQNYQPIDEQKEGQYYELIESQLEENGFFKYEVSNFSKQGYESLHNSVYWQYQNYLGVGVGATGMVDGVREENTHSLTLYLQGHVLKKKEEISLADQMFEMIMMGLRLTKGMSMNDFEQRFHVSFMDEYRDVIEKYRTMDLLVCEDGYLKVNKRGMEVLHDILIDFIKD